MRLEFDLNAGALYIRLSDAEIARTDEAGDNAAVDLDSSGGVVGIEVISAAHPWPLAGILHQYRIPADEMIQIQSYFQIREHQAAPREPVLSISSLAPATVAA